MNRYGRGTLSTGFILLTTTLLAACGAGSSESTLSSTDPATSIIGNRGAGLVPGGTATTGTSTGTSTGSSTGSTSTGSGSSPGATLALSGKPAASIVAGEAYAFAPTAVHATGTVSFSITNKPAWAHFDASTGALSGTPSAGDVGSTAGILISATDGSSRATLAVFTLSVSATGAHVLTLTWSAPDDNADGTPLVDLSGYKIHYGTRTGSYTKTIAISNASLSRYVVDNLGSGTYYFAISAYNQAGTESQLSGELSTTLD